MLDCYQTDQSPTSVCELTQIRTVLINLVISNCLPFFTHQHLKNDMISATEATFIAENFYMVKIHAFHCVLCFRTSNNKINENEFSK